jgi:hypothetical protein
MGVWAIQTGTGAKELIALTSVVMLVHGSTIMGPVERDGTDRANVVATYSIWVAEVKGYA